MRKGTVHGSQLKVYGKSIERYEYNAYGMPTIYNAGFTQTYDTSQYGNPYLFTGRRLDNFDSDNLRLQYNRNRYYDYYSGRWLSHDPLGITPNPQKPNRFAIHDQYSDEMNLYEYVTSKPMCNKDPHGMFVNIFENLWNKFACCKVENTHHVPGYWTKKHRILRSYYVPPISYKSCSLKTIINWKGRKPMSACKCKLESVNTKVIGARRGICCFCDVYMDKTLPGFLISSWTHPYLNIVCPSIDKAWIIDAEAPGKDWLNFKEHPGQKPRIRDYTSSEITSKKDFHKYSYRGQVTCKVAQIFIKELEGFTFTYKQPNRECNYWANKWFKDLMDLMEKEELCKKTLL